MTDVPLPGDRPPASQPAAAEGFRAAVRFRHRPVLSHHGRAPYCVLDAQPWPCEPITLLRALEAAEPAARLLEEHRDLLDSALDDAIEHREEGGRCADCQDRGTPCFDHDADAARAGEYDRLRGQLRELP